MLKALLFCVLLVSVVYCDLPDSATIQQILAKHNAYRNGTLGAFQPGFASPAMPALVWNTSLADLASGYANGCNWEHNPNRGATGENLAAYGPATNQGRIIDSVVDWYNEQPWYDINTNICTPPASGGSCGHYTQVMWNTTTQVGCGFRNCGSIVGAGFGGTFVVCNYFPAGNMNGRRPYNPSGSAPASPSPSPSRSPTRSPAVPASPSSSPTRSPVVPASPSRSPTRSPVGPASPSPSPTRSPAVPASPSRSPTRSPAVPASPSPSPTRSPAPPASSGTSGPPNWNQDFTVASGSGVMSIASGNVLTVAGAGETIVRYSRTQAYTVIDPAYTRVKLEAILGVGQGFGVGLRVGQTASTSDGIYIQLSDIGTATMNLRSRIRQNNAYTASGSSLALPTGFWVTGQSNFVEAILTTNGTTTQVSWSHTTPTGWTASYATIAPVSMAPATGTVGFWFNSPTSAGSPGMKSLSVNTGSALTISLFNCVDLTTWTQMFYSLTGLNPATTSVQTRVTGTNAACKAAGAKEAASGFALIIESSTVAATTITQNFATAVESGSPAIAALGVKSATVLPGTEAVALAGILPAAAPEVLAPAAAGGGGAAGLSGGAIAGIVIGSVGGAVLIVAVAAIIVAAVIVAAVVVAKKSEDDEESGPTRADTSARRSFRQSIHNLFRAPRGGVDVMNSPKGHQSISARSPPLQH